MARPPPSRSPRRSQILRPIFQSPFCQHFAETPPNKRRAVFKHSSVIINSPPRPPYDREGLIGLAARKLRALPQNEVTPRNQATSGGRAATATTTTSPRSPALSRQGPYPDISLSLPWHPWEALRSPPNVVGKEKPPRRLPARRQARPHGTCKEEPSSPFKPPEKTSPESARAIIIFFF